MDQKESSQANNRAQVENKMSWQNWVTWFCVFRINFVEALILFFLNDFLSHLKSQRLNKMKL